MKNVSLVSVLTIIFVLAKIMGYIDWSWWWVFAPLWIGFILGTICLIVMLAIAVIADK